MESMYAVLTGPMGKIPLAVDRFTIGRAPDNQLVLSNDPKVSSHHAAILMEHQNYLIVDLGSTNHTFVNEQEFYHNAPHLLHHGDMIRIGDTPFTFTYEVANAFQNQPPVSDGSTQRAEAGPPAFTGMGTSAPMVPGSGISSMSGAAEQFGTNYGGATSDIDETYLKPQPSFASPPPQQGFVVPQVSQSVPVPPTAYPANPPMQSTQNQAFNATSYPQQQPVQPAGGMGGYPADGSVQNRTSPPFMPSMQPPPQPPFTPPKRSGLSIGLIALIIVALLVIIASASFLFIAHNNQIAISNASATSTANAQTQTAHSTAVARAHATSAVVHATATFVAQYPNPYPPHTGTIVFVDTLVDASSVQTNQWDQNNNCQFRNGGYHASESNKNTFFVCGAHAQKFADFTYRVEMTIVSGDCGGIVFRSDHQNQNLYLYEVCTDGTFSLATYSGTSGQYLINHQSNSAIIRTAGQVNLIAVVAKGNILNLYDDNVLLGSQSDTKFASGEIGVYADNYASAGTDIQFNNARVWKL